MEYLQKSIVWVAGIIFAALIIYVIFANGVHSARQDVCDKVGGVYVQTYSRGPQCINADIIQMK